MAFSLQRHSGWMAAEQRGRTSPGSFPLAAPCRLPMLPGVAVEMGVWVVVQGPFALGHRENVTPQGCVEL